ncbi:MAG: carboxypeptidase-like regulatory domain-containing protein [Thermoguttaceae bacterium]|nr:carboxypeptidase-like regulatory domain-containing protein [Thermoguttaceae bacterium]
MRMIQGCLVALCICIVFSLVGCTRNPMKAVDVQGVVTLDGTPVEGATVTFKDSSNLFASGRTDAQGRYFLNMPGSPVPGIKEGEYKVTIRKTDADSTPAKSWEELEARGKSDSKEAPQVAKPPKELLPVQYKDFGKSGLTASVKEATQDCNFELKSK